MKARVVPHAGTWIEILINESFFAKILVVPHAGTWIEMLLVCKRTHTKVRRSPRGNVD